MTILYEVRDKHVPGLWREQRRDGISIQDPVTKELMELFTIGIFAEAIGRKTDIIKKWEHAKLIPKPLWRVEKKQCTHWYSAVQVVNCHLLMRTKYKGLKYFSEVSTHREFLADISSLWLRKEVVVTLEGNIKE